MMKKIFVTTFTIAFLTVTFGQTKRALIIAIGEYAKKGEFKHMNVEKGYWSNINSANDVPLIKGALNHHGFDNKNIATLQDKKATKDGVLNAIDQLIQDAQRNDIVVFHYSGHGQQIFDDNLDEYDGYDEAIVPYDAPSKYKKGIYEGEKHIRDDQVGELMTKLRRKLGPDGHLLIVFDACHSGTATRGIASARGTEDKLEPENNQAISNDEAEEVFFGGASLDEKGLAPYVLFSGSSASELNFETFDENNRRVGSLSYCFSRAMANADKNTSYIGMFDQIRTEMSSKAPRQSPQIEGDVDNKLLSGEARPALTYYTVKNVIDDKNITVEGGMLLGLLEGTEVAFYDVDADTAKAEPKARGRVVQAYELESDILLDQPLTEKEAMNSWIYVTQQNFGGMEVRVQLAVNDNPKMEKLIRNRLNEYGLAIIVDENPELVIEMNNEYTNSRGADFLQVITSDEHELMSSSVQSGQEEMLAEKIVKDVLLPFSQTNFLRKLELENERIGIELSIIPVSIERKGRSVVVKEHLDPKNFMRDGILVLEEGEHFIIGLKNTRSTDVYITVLDIFPDNDIYQVFPGEKRTADEYFIRSGSEIIFDEPHNIFEIGPPYGVDNLKLIATEEPLNLRNVISTRGSSSRGNTSSNPFEILLGESYKSGKEEGSRGPSTTSVPPAAGSVSTTLYRIAPKGGRGE
jgi:hypothetical protein